MGIRAAEALGVIGDERAVPVLLEALRSRPASVQLAAARSLRQLDIPDPGDEITEHLVDIVETAGDDHVRALAAQELHESPGGAERVYAGVEEALETDRYQEALDQLDTALSPLGGEVEVRWLRALALKGLSRMQEALEMIECVLEALPDFASALSLRAEILSEFDRTDDALEAIHEAAQRHPDDADLQFVLGWWSYVDGQLDQSIAASRRTLELRPENVAAHFNLGLALLADGDAAAALETYRLAVNAALATDPASAREAITDATGDFDELRHRHRDASPVAASIGELLCATRNDLGADTARPGDDR